MTIRSFDAVLAMRVAKRIRNIEPLAAELLEQAVEEITQNALEQAELEVRG